MHVVILAEGELLRGMCVD